MSIKGRLCIVLFTLIHFSLPRLTPLPYESVVDYSLAKHEAQRENLRWRIQRISKEILRWIQNWLKGYNRLYQ